MAFAPGVSGNPRGRPRGARNKTTRAVAEWTAAILEDPQVQARFLADARAGKLHPSVMTVLLAYAYGKPRETISTEPMVSMSEIEEARHTLRAKLQHMTDSPESRSR